MSSCLGCEQSAEMVRQQLDNIIQKAAKEGEKNQVDMVVYYTPEGWQFIRADQSVGLPVRHLVLYTRPEAG